MKCKYKQFSTLSFSTHSPPNPPRISLSPSVVHTIRDLVLISLHFRFFRSHETETKKKEHGKHGCRLCAVHSCIILQPLCIVQHTLCSCSLHITSPCVCAKNNNEIKRDCWEMHMSGCCKKKKTGFGMFHGCTHIAHGTWVLEIVSLLTFCLISVRHFLVSFLLKHF